MGKYTKEELFKMDAVDVYKMVLKGDIIKTFPKGFWQQPEAKQNAAKCTRYLIEEVLKYDDEKLKNINSLKNIFSQNKLAGMLVTCFNYSPYEAINNTYQNKFKEWEFKQVPKGYWDSRENSLNAVKWMIEEKLKLSDEELKEQLSIKLFIENGLIGMLTTCFNGSVYEAINGAYPNKFKEWELKNVPLRYWEDEENGIKATRWLIEEKLKLNDKELKEQFGQKLFKSNGLNGMLKYCFNNSPYQAINKAYPGKYKEWEFKYVPMRYWENKNNGIKSTKWLIEEKLKLNDDELKEQLSQNLFVDNGLGGMLQHCFNGSPYEAINSTYPNKYKEWEFKHVPNGYWINKENGIKATKWLIEEKLKLDDEQLKEQLSVNLFIQNGLGSMLQHCFNGSTYEAINSIYPNKFKRWELTRVPKGYWVNEEHSIEAVKWLIEERLKLRKDELKEKLSIKIFVENGLGSMLQYCFNGSISEAISRYAQITIKD